MVTREGINAATRKFKPGVRLGEAVHEAKKVIESAGLELRGPMGHLCGLNLVEARVELESKDILQPGMIIIFHPIVGSGDTQMFSGETYLITPEGHQCLNQAPDNLPTV
jgi:Xaa-Pro aminopeptidase